MSIYKVLFKALRDQGFLFFPFSEGISDKERQIIILRQDVDLIPENSLEFARIQSEVGIESTFYFRSVPESFDENIITEIHKLGHEIGYHYEDLALARQKTKVKRQKLKPDQHDFPDSKTARLQDRLDLKDHRHHEKELVDSAIESFASNLEKLRRIVPVKTICMHGSPMSRWDSRLLWKYYDYRDFGIVAEPYFDLDFDEVFYLTDTGRRWDGDKFSVRDKRLGNSDEGIVNSEQGIVNSDQGIVNSEKGVVSSDEGIGNSDKGYGGAFADWKVKPYKYRLRDEGTERRDGTSNQQPATSSQQPASRTPHLEAKRRSRFSGTAPFPRYHSTSDIIKALNEGTFPTRAMITMHPQRWTNKPVPWVRELVWQNAKNVVKYFLVRGGSE